MNNQSVIAGILHDELQRNLRMQSSYKKELEMLPRGSVMQRKIGNSIYLYMKYRVGTKVITEYIGRLVPELLQEIEEKIKHRKYLQNLLKQLKLEENEIRRAIK